MIIDVRGKDSGETCHNTVDAMIKLGFSPVRVICTECGEDCFVFQGYEEDEDGYYKYRCDFCGGKMKK